MKVFYLLILYLHGKVIIDLLFPAVQLLLLPDQFPAPVRLILQYIRQFRETRKSVLIQTVSVPVICDPFPDRFKKSLKPGIPFFSLGIFPVELRKLLQNTEEHI